MVTLACAVVAYLRSLFLPRNKLALQAVALRQQLSVFKRKQPRPKLDRVDQLFWIVLRRLWEGWFEALIIVKPETVVSWHRAGFRQFWRSERLGNDVRLRCHGRITEMRDHNRWFDKVKTISYNEHSDKNAQRETMTNSADPRVN